jgi:hypothetical protein
MNIWETVIDYMNRNVGMMGSRKDLLDYIQSQTETWENHGQYIQVVERRKTKKYINSFNTIDCYKNYLIQAGLIQKIKINGKELRGKFFIPLKIDYAITIEEVRKMAYGPTTMIIGTDTSSLWSSAGRYANYTDYKNHITEKKPKKKKHIEPEFLSEEEMRI